MQQQPRSGARLGANALRAAVLSTCSSNRGRLSPKRAALHVTRRPRPPPDARVLFHARTSSGKGTRAWGLLFCPARRDGQEGGVFFAPSRRDVTLTTAPAGALGGPGDTANAHGDSIPGKKTDAGGLDAGTPACLGAAEACHGCAGLHICDANRTRFARLASRVTLTQSAPAAFGR